MKKLGNKIILMIIIIVLIFVLNVDSFCQELIVKFKHKPVSQHLPLTQLLPTASQNLPVKIKPVALLSHRSVDKLKRFSKIGIDRIVKIHIPDGVNPGDFLSSLQNNPDIEYAHTIRTYRIDELPNDPRINEQWLIQKIELVNAWDITLGNEQILVGIIDTGIDYLHEDLASNIRINPGEDLNQNSQFDSTDINNFDDDGNGFVDDIFGWDFTDAPHFPDGGDYHTPDNNPADEHGHGTSVAGIIAATANNLIGIAGIAPECKILNLRAGTSQGLLEEDDVASAIIYAVDNGARIINMSFGDVACSQMLRDVMQFAFECGVVLIASAGNSGSAEIHYPSSLPQVISVGATTSNDALASFSSFGTTVDLVAPGVQLLTTARGNSYRDFSGTSASAPVVSGVAALILSHQPDLTNEDVKNVLISTTDDLGENGWDTHFAAGRVNANKALRANYVSQATIQSPELDKGFSSSPVVIIGTAAGAFLESYELSFGFGDIPNQWFPIIQLSHHQIIKDTLGVWNIEELPDSSYTIRLRVQNKDESFIEDKTRIYIDHSPPKLILFSSKKMIDGFQYSQLLEFETDDVTRAKIFYREVNTSSPFKEISLNYEVQQHRYNFVISGDFEFYLQFLNRANLVSIADHSGNYYRLDLSEPFLDTSRFLTLDFTLPALYLLNKTIDFDSDGNLEFIAVPLTANHGFGNLNLFEFEQGQFHQTEILPDIFIPRDIGDSDNDGQLEILAGVGPRSFILEQTPFDVVPREIVWSDSNDFWASRFADLDQDEKYEIIARINEEFKIYECTGDNQFQQVASLPNPTSGSNYTGVPHTEIGDFDNDQRSEILIGDYDGDIYIYEAAGDNLFQQTWSDHLPLIDAINFISSGDYDGDGVTEFAAGCHSSPDLDLEHEYDGRYWVFRIYDSNGNDNYQPVWEQAFFGFADPADFDSGISSGDTDNDGRDELLINIFPDFYIIDFDSTKNVYQPIGYFSPAQCQTNLVADFDKDQKNEFFISDGNSTIVLQDRYATSDVTPPAPSGFQAYPLNGAHVFLQWLPVTGINQYKIYRGNSIDHLDFLASCNNNSAIDSSVQSGQLYWYAVSAIYNEPSPVESKKTNPIAVRPGDQPYLMSADFIPPNQLRVTFNEQMDKSITDFSHYHLWELDAHPRSAVRAENFRAVLLTFAPDILAPGNYTLLVSDVRDADLTPIDTSKNTITFTVTPINPSFYVRNAHTESDGSIVVQFNLPVDEESATSPENYSFEPPLILEKISLDPQNQNQIILIPSKNQSLNAPVTEFILSVQNVYSASGIPLDQNKGSQIRIDFMISSLQQAVIFPNPYIADYGNGFITFAHLINGTSVKIVTCQGQVIRALTDENNNGTVYWDLKDENGNDVASGVYVFFLFHSGKQRKGKLAIVR